MSNLYAFSFILGQVGHLVNTMEKAAIRQRSQRMMATTDYSRSQTHDEIYVLLRSHTFIYLFFIYLVTYLGITLLSFDEC